jgi:hypothetical protein
MLPDFLIVGAMKSGTSTLAHYLRQHDQLFLPSGEVHFFDKEEEYRKGVPWYREQFSEADRTQTVGEKTPTYSYKPGVPERIHDTLPDVKIVWIFREPVSRSYSNYWHAVRAGVELMSFKEAVQKEEERTKEDFWRGYVDRSRYVEQIERFRAHFDLEQMHFTLFENLKSNAAEVLTGIFQFLGVENRPCISEMEVQKNQSFLPRSVRLQWVAESILGRSRWFHAFKKINARSYPGYPPMDADMRRQLEARFAEPNRRLAELTGQDLSPWD